MDYTLSIKCPKWSHEIDCLCNGTAGFKNVNNCSNANIYCYLETPGGQNYNLYINVVHFFNTSVNYISVAA